MPSKPAKANMSLHYRPEIDGLRAIAVLAVFVFHLKREWLPGGFVGVDVFFVISGYLITSLILRECDYDHFSYVRFYQRRIARLLPAFIFAASITVSGSFLIYSPQDLASTGANLVAATLSATNIKLLFQGDYFVLSQDSQPFLHHWSLAVEEQFYLLFPVTVRLLLRRTPVYAVSGLLIITSMSLIICIVLTERVPKLAFFLLPPRAWELLAGSVLAMLPAIGAGHEVSRGKYLPSIGLAILALSFVAINENLAVPGYLAIFPVAGAICILSASSGTASASWTFLSWSPIVAIGRVSYSLYLLHWPIFSLVDYHLYLHSSALRLSLKLGLTFVATYLCFALIERPARQCLGRQMNRRLTFSLLGGTVVLFVASGTWLRNHNYINAEASSVGNGGLLFNEHGKNGSIVLMGDSNASMYGKTMIRIAKDVDLRLNIISVAGGDPLPGTERESGNIWNNSESFIRQVRPDYVVLACNWGARRITDDPHRLAVALDQLLLSARRVIIVTQPPRLPESATREGRRSGARPPFFEESEDRHSREQSTATVRTFQNSNVSIVDAAPRFAAQDGGILVSTEQLGQFFQDRDHLSTAGANRLHQDIVEALLGHRQNYSPKIR